MIVAIATLAGFGRVATHANISVQDYALGSDRCTVQVNYIDADGDFIAQNRFLLDGSAFDAWGSDDNYIVQQAAERCGFEVIPNA